MARFIAYNGARPTTAKFVAVTTGTSIKTLLQVGTPSTSPIKVIEWGISFDGTAANTPIPVELLETDVGATVTAHVASGVMPWDVESQAAASLMTLSTTATGYTSTGEGSITATRLFDVQQISPTTQYWKQFPLGREPQVAVSKFLRVRVHAATAVNAITWIAWEE